VVSAFFGEKGEEGQRGGGGGGKKVARFFADPEILEVLFPEDGEKRGGERHEERKESKVVGIFARRDHLADGAQGKKKDKQSRTERRNEAAAFAAWGVVLQT